MSSGDSRKSRFLWNQDNSYMSRISELKEDKQPLKMFWSLLGRLQRKTLSWFLMKSLQATKSYRCRKCNEILATVFRRMKKKEKNQNERMKCFYCKKNNNINSYESFTNVDGERKFEKIRSKNLCGNCVSPFHFSGSCKRKWNDTITACEEKRKHITAIHQIESNKL